MNPKQGIMKRAVKAIGSTAKGIAAGAAAGGLGKAINNLKAEGLKSRIKSLPSLGQKPSAMPSPSQKYKKLIDPIRPMPRQMPNLMPKLKTTLPAAGPRPAPMRNNGTLRSEGGILKVPRRGPIAKPPIITQA